MNVEALQAFTWAAKEFGAASEESVTAKLVKLVDAQGKAIYGNKQMEDAFRRLGISLDEVARLGTDELLYRVARGAQTSGTAVADLNEIFGRGAAFEMKDALDKLANDGMGNLIDQAKAAGQVLETELIQKMARLNDDFARAKTEASNFFIQTVGWLNNWRKDFVDFWREVWGGKSLTEAGRMLTNNEIGANADVEADGIQLTPKAKEKLRRYAEQRAREQALQDRLAREAAARQAKIDKIMGAPMPDISVTQPQAADQYARIGLFSGGQVNASGRIAAERQLKIQEEMARRLAKVEEIMSQVERNTATVADNTED
jgi:hypothetical protein